MGIFRDRPTPQGDNLLGGAGSRAGRYGESVGLNMGSVREYGFADEGSFFVAINPTAGTGILGHAAPTTFDEAKAYLTLYNGGTNRIYPQFLRLYDTAVSVLAARMQFAFTLDNTNRFSSGGTALTKNNVNMDSSNASQATINAGAVVSTAASASRRLLGNYQLRGTIDVVEDVYEFVWGGAGVGTSNHSRVATVSTIGCTLPPMVVGPGHTLCIHQWASGQTTGPTFEIVLGYVER